MGVVATLAGCATAGGGEVSLSSLTEAPRKTIDPGYTLAPEESAPRREDAPLSKITQRAAELAKEQGQTFAAAVHLCRLHEADPKDARRSFECARQLRYGGALTDAERVLNNGLAASPTDPLLRLERGKLLIAAGRGAEAIATLEPLSRSHSSDPAVLQAYGVALDRQGRHDEATAVYQSAMSLGRPAAALLNNAGMSRLMAGDLAQAETLLRKASVAPGANAQVRQNLALALSLKGDAAEARRIVGDGPQGDVAALAIDAYGEIPVADPWSAAKAQ